MKRILVIVPDGCDEMEVAPYVEMPGWTKVVEGVERVDVTVAGWDDEICMFHGLRVVPDIKVGEAKAEDYDAVFLPGGWHGTRYFEQAHGPLMKGLLRRMHESGKIVATACNGIVAAGEAGLLKGLECTSFSGECCEYCRDIENRIRGYGAKFEHRAIVEDRKILSNIGPAVADEDALRLLEMLIGRDDVTKIVDMMMYPTVRPGDLRWTAPVAASKAAGHGGAAKRPLPVACAVKRRPRGGRVAGNIERRKRP